MQKGGNLFLSVSAALLLFAGCEKEKIDWTPGAHTAEPSWAPTDLPSVYGISYLYDESTLPEIHLEVPLEEWNSLLSAYDTNPQTSLYVHCDARYIKDSQITVVRDAGLKLHGNSSRARPESPAGKLHDSTNPRWRHSHFVVNFRKFHKDENHTVHGARKVMLKFFHGDPAYVREVYSFDFYRRAGVWTAVHDVYCKVYIHVSGDAKEAYYGVYEMLEPIDEQYLKVRKNNFGDAGGFLWKCRNGATLNDNWLNPTYGADLGTGEKYTYELKTNTGDYDKALAQLQNFMHNLNNLPDGAFYRWMESVCDVELLLRTYACNVALGLWDDYWNNANNFYIYFNSTDTERYQMFFIPYDCDNSIGNIHPLGMQKDAATHNPFSWGLPSCPLIQRLMKDQKYRDIYARELLRLTDPAEHLLYYECSDSRISRWHAMISPYIQNDTKQHGTITDRSAWPSLVQYPILDPDAENNYFKVKTESIRSYCAKQ